MEPPAVGEPGAPERVAIEEHAAPGTQGSAKITDNLYEPYQPQRLRIAGAQPHPGPLVESAAMASVAPPPATYQPAFPKALINKGLLSLPQLEPVVYAGQAHQKMLPSIEGEMPKRKGYFIGDGTGVGKGREIAGIILDNWRQGRTKAVWVSEKKKLLNDAKRDWTGLGQDVNHLFDLGKVKAGEPITAERGIGFVTYDTLKGGLSDQAALARGNLVRRQKVVVNGAAGTVQRVIPDRRNPQVVVKLENGTQVTVPVGQATPVEATATVKSRIDQLADWLGKDFDGVIAFDEAHNMANVAQTKGKRGTKDAAQKAIAGLELQNRLPNARIVYVSATGATEVSNLGYADRLGLWGRGTPFASREQFVTEVDKGGIAAMELIARDMKQLGLYTARNLSFDDGTPKGRVEYDRLEHRLDKNQREIYDTAAEAWQVVLSNINKALELTGGSKDSRAKSAAMSAFWGAHQRFFNQIVTSLQMPSVVKAAERDLKEGRQVVLQLTNTNEASQERAAAKATTAEEIEDLDITPRDQLIQLVEHSFPTQQYESYVDEDGKERSRPVVDSEGNPVQNAEAVAARDALIDQLASIRVPQGPLDLILDHFGVDNVAEVTGRKRRFVLKEDEKTGEVKRQEESRPTSSANQGETDAFQAGKKKIIVFSEAGGTGASYHADNASASKDARRSHYLVQAGWRADKAVQGLGRSHRTNQGSAPIFHLVSTDLDGQKRFISTIARRLAQLGALTKGQRQAGEQGIFSQRDNLESTEATTALQQFYHDLASGSVEGVSLPEFERQTGLRLMERDEDGRTLGMRQELPPITQFLNRLLSLKIDLQNKVFREFSDRLDNVIETRQQAGLMDVGLETLRADKITKDQEQIVHLDKASGAETRYVKLTMADKFHPTQLDDVVANKVRPVQFWAKSPQGRVYAVVEAPHYTEADTGRITERYRLIGPSSSRLIDQDELGRGTRWQKIDKVAARPLWQDEIAKAPEYTTKDLHLITGTILPIWDRLRGSPRVVRTQTDDGERFLGRVIPQSHLAETLRALGAEATQGAANPKDVVSHLMAGGRASLANGWTLKRSLVAGEDRIELVGPASFSEGEQVKRDGVFTERIDYKTRYFVPTEPEQAERVIAAITEHRPVVDMTGGSTKEAKLYSAPRRPPEPNEEEEREGGPGPYLGEEDYPRRARVPGVDWSSQDLQDTSRRVTEDTILRDYVQKEDQKRVRVYQSWVPMEDIPSPKLVEEEESEEGEDNGGYDWSEYRHGASFPPVKLEVDKNGKVSIVDGNHRLRYFDEAGYEYAPAYVIDHRPAADKAYSAPRPTPIQQPWYYSAVERAVASAKQEKASPEQWAATLRNVPGVKPEEMAWLGLDDFLRQHKGPVTKQEIADYVRAHRIEVREVEKGDTEPPAELVAEKRRLLDEQNDLVNRDAWANLHNNEPAVRRQLAAQMVENERRIREINDAILAEGAPTKFPTYTLPGGSNYRELLLTLPDIQSSRLADLEVKVNAGTATLSERQEYHALVDRGTHYFRGSHWDEPNVLAHVRFDDRTGPNGERILHVAEIQSDWHQKGRKGGYDRPNMGEEYAVYGHGQRLADSLTKEEAEAEAARRRSLDPTSIFTVDRTGYQLRGEVPDAPFKTTWPELSLKRIIRYAAEHGYDALSFDTGETNAERYDLSKQVKAVHWYPEGGRLNVIKQGESLPTEIATGIPSEKLPDYIGKETAEKLINAPVMGGAHVMTGLDLKVGGEGQKAFYDKILPAAANKLVKKFGAKVEPSTVPLGKVIKDTDGWVAMNQAGQIVGRFATEQEAQAASKEPANLIRITPELRKAAVEQGFPLFRDEARAATLPLKSDKASVGKRQRLEAALNDALRHMLGPNAPRLELPDRIAMEGPSGWGLTPLGEHGPTGGYTGAQRLAASLIEVALGHPSFDRRPNDAFSTFVHEIAHAFHDHMASPEELALFEREIPRMRERAKEFRGMTDEEAASLKPREAIATDFERYATGRATGNPGTGTHIGLRRFYERILQFLRDVANMLRRRFMYTRAEDIWSDLYEGRMADRPDLKTGREFASREPVLPGEEGRVAEPTFGVAARVEGGGKLYDVGRGTAASAGTSTKTAKRWIPEKVEVAADYLMDLGASIRDAITPMAGGRPEGRAAAKDYADEARAIDYDLDHEIRDITKKWTPEQRREMWDRANEEGEAINEGRPVAPGTGLSRLDPEQQAYVRKLVLDEAPRVWQAMKNVGMADGDGLKFWVPRIAVMMSETGHYSKAQPSGEGGTYGDVGRGFTTTAGSAKRRKYKTAAETEAAMKGKFGEGAQLARDIAALPLALAKLKKAIQARILINKIKALSKEYGADLVHEGASPGPRFFTLDHPAFFSTRPQLKKMPDGTWSIAKHEDGSLAFERIPIFIHKDLKAPLLAVLGGDTGKVYRALMTLRAKVMVGVMYSPAIHNIVEWSRAFPTHPGQMLTLRLYHIGNAAKNDRDTMREFICGGMVPIGRRFVLQQEMSSIMEAPQLAAGRSITAHALSYLPGLFDQRASEKTKQTVDKMGDFWHNTLLWDRVADLQVGLAVETRDDMLRRGYPRQAAVIVGAHMANRYAGSLPLESMSTWARVAANMIFFSRTFTFGNLGAMKDAVTGLPRDVQAQLLRLGEDEMKRARNYSRRKALATVGLDYALQQISTTIFASAVAMMGGAHLGSTLAGGAAGAIGSSFIRRGAPGHGIATLLGAIGGAAAGYAIGQMLWPSTGWSTLDKEVEGYVNRLQKLIKRVESDPTYPLRHPFEAVQSLGKTAENEAGKRDKILVGHQADGTAIYARNPLGKMSEDQLGLFFDPVAWLLRKTGVFAKPLAQAIANDHLYPNEVRKTPVFDKTDDASAIKNIARFFELYLEALLPNEAIRSGIAALTGKDLPSLLPGTTRTQNDEWVNVGKVVDPFLGVTISKGYPGGEKAAEKHHEREQRELRRTFEYSAPKDSEESLQQWVKGERESVLSDETMSGPERAERLREIQSAAKAARKAMNKAPARGAPDYSSPTPHYTPGVFDRNGTYTPPAAPVPPRRPAPTAPPPAASGNVMGRMSPFGGYSQ